MITVAWDTETTGLDLYHEARPFFVTACVDDDSKDEWEIKYWEWNVNYKNRIPQIPNEDLYEIRKLLDSADRLIGQNMKFDVTALESIGVYAGRTDVFSTRKELPGQDGIEFPWEKVEDTLIAGHMLYTSRKHDLTSMVTQYLNDDPDNPCDIKPLETKLHQCTEQARRECRKKGFRETYGTWKIADKNQKGMPSAKGGKSVWHMDTWLPLAMAKECEYPPDHPFYTVLENYANADSEYTLALWYRMEKLIKQRKLWDIYRCRMDVVPVGQRMERASVTGSAERALKQSYDLKDKRTDLEYKCLNIARKNGITNLTLPKSGTNREINRLIFDTFKLPIIKKSDKTGQPSLDKDVLEHYAKTAPQGDVLDFVVALQNKRKCDTSISYLDGYNRFWIDLHSPKEYRGYFKMHPFLNPTGTVQLRWSSSNPNEQNISKQEGYNLRYAFGPLPDREWWSLDYQNLELRIPTFESGETKLMEVFLKPKDPPYFGSYHLVVFDVLHPEIFARHGKAVKDTAPYDSTLYQWVKNGNFAMIYGCGKKKADATFKVPGAYEIMREKFPNIAKLADKQMADARKYGYVQTIPDRTVDPVRGFPVMASRTDSGAVLPTTPLNYHVSGTACWATAKAMIRCENRLRSWAEEGVWKGTKIPAHMKLQVHDEIVFDFPKSIGDVKEDLAMEKENKGPITYTTDSTVIDIDSYKSNLGYVRALQKEMEKSGEDLGMPLPVGVEYNAENWADITTKC